MNSLTIFMTILVFAVDLSLALECNCCGDTEKLQMVSCRHYYCNTCTNKFTKCTTCRTEFTLGNNNRTALNVLKCAVCGNVKEIKKGSSCTHIHCENCLHYVTNCFTCKKIIRDAQILTCSICSLPNILYEENNKIYCTSCQSLGFVPQETGASSSRQNNAPPQFGVWPFNQNNVRPQFGVPTSNQYYGNDTIEVDLLHCNVCTNVNKLQQNSCSHLYCNTCLSYLTLCSSCGKDFTDLKYIYCSMCQEQNNLLKSSGRIYCMKCKSKGFVPQMARASSSRQSLVPQMARASSFRQNNVRPQFGVPPFNQSLVPQMARASSFRQNNVRPQFGVPTSNQSVPSETEDPLSNQSVPSETEDPLSNQCDDTEGSNRPPILYNFFS